MFERFTDRARRVVVLAQEEARLLNHNYIGTEHLLLGLVHEHDGVGAKALTLCDVSLEAARAQVQELVGRGEVAPSGHVPFSPAAKKAIERSLREALQLAHNYIGTEHILLGMLRQDDSVALQILAGLGVEPARLRQEVIQLLAGYARSTDPPPTQEELLTKAVLDALVPFVAPRLVAEAMDSLRQALKEWAGAAE